MKLTRSDASNCAHPIENSTSIPQIAPQTVPNQVATGDPPNPQLIDPTCYPTASEAYCIALSVYAMILTRSGASDCARAFRNSNSMPQISPPPTW